MSCLWFHIAMALRRHPLTPHPATKTTGHLTVRIYY